MFDKFSELRTKDATVTIDKIEQTVQTEPVEIKINIARMTYPVYDQSTGRFVADQSETILESELQSHITALTKRLDAAKELYLAAFSKEAK